MTFQEWLASTFGTSVVLIGLVAAFKDIILKHVAESVKHKYNKELETHISELRHKSELALKDIEVRANERNIKLTEIFTKQANVVVETHTYIVTTERLIKLAHDLMRYQNDETHENMSQLSSINKKAYDAFQESFKINKIYLPRQTAKQMDSYLAVVAELLTKSSLIAGLTPLAKANNWDKQIDELKAEVEQLEKNIPVLLETLEDDFQRILGFPMPEKAKTP